MPDFSFKLLPDFLEKYKNVEPPFGFRDVAGNSLGEITYSRTYSRLKENGNKETWVEAVERVTDATYTIQKNHVKENKLEWNDQKAQSSAKEFFDRLFNLKFTPPGRGLQQMGSPQVMGGNSASLQNCFSYDTEFVTKQGIRSLGEMSGQSVEVWANGDWVKAKVQEFGSQPIQEIHFVPFGSKTNHKVIVKATPNHRWELRNGEVTDHLSENDVVSSSVVASYDFNSEGFRHGLIFADGSINHTYANGDFGHMMRLCGKKERWKFLFDNIQYQPNCEGDPVVYFRSETNMKSLPKTKDASYLASFIRGWLEFDGHSEGPSYVLDTQNAEASAWLEKNCIYAGFVTIGKSVDSSPTNFGERSFPLNRIRLSSKPDRMWKVVKINPFPEEEPVYCAVVPGVERFTLAGGIYTGNCAVISTGDIERHDPGKVFEWAMLALMYGVGVGADMLGAKKNIEIRERTGEPFKYVVSDDREGWADSLRILLNSYLRHNNPVEFDYSLIRPKGAPLVSFGGKASGPEPLIRLHATLEKIFDARVGKTLDSETITDIFNLVGSCVIAGSTRRSAEIMMGEYDDEAFLDLKNPEVYPERNSYDPSSPGWAWASNNSINVPVGADYSKYLDRIATNGEPGLIWMDVAKTRGRMIDPPDDKDRRIAGFNPCSEQPLESQEMCTLVTVHLQNAESKEDFLRTLKFAFLYAKTVTLMPTPWTKTNSVMQRNRRIGLSLTGITDVVDRRGLPEILEWMEAGYKEVRRLDHIYSEWLCVRESNRVTTIKPEGSVSLLSGASPGIHWGPGGKFYLRAIRFGNNDPMLSLFRWANYKVEADLVSDDTSVVYFPMKTNSSRSEKEVSVFEKIGLAAKAQHHWSDNGVSVTVSFDPETEKHLLVPALRLHEGSLKSVSFLPMSNQSYPQQPYTQITEEEYEGYKDQLMKIDFNAIYQGVDNLEAEGEKYCTTDTCMI